MNTLESILRFKKTFIQGEINDSNFKFFPSIQKYKKTFIQGEINDSNYDNFLQVFRNYNRQ